MAPKGELVDDRSRTCTAKVRAVPNTADVAGRASSLRRSDSSHSLGTPASKGWRGFQRNRPVTAGGQRQAGRKVRASAKPGSPKQRDPPQFRHADPRLASQAHAKGERFRDPCDGARKPARDITSANPVHDGQACHARKRFRLRSESARDSCPRAMPASGRGHSTSRRFSGCDTWQPKPFCGPRHACS
ncbi:hypothetical protein DR64_5305 [Paraburkholderia xenovorans LB400]|jgi:hypothetical protein|nr:hypothetical protein DR64_5305 [Paraburkholderia xenovorans LB400]